MSYRQKLIAAFASLCALVLIQSILAYALVHNAQLLEQRSLIAQELLVAYTNISADKQRLKVWYAEQLLTGAAQASTRDALIDRINANILVVRQRLPLQQDDAEQTQALMAGDADVLNIIEANFANFKRTSFNVKDLSRNDVDKQLIWTEILRTFDLASGRDVRILLGNAIAQQSKISKNTVLQADLALQRSNWLRLAMLIVTLSIALIMARYFVRRLKQPLDELMLGTSKLQHLSADNTWQVPVRGHDEFASLAANFNAMGTEIVTRRASDLARTEALEQAVRVRTSELTQANDVLRLIDTRRRQFFSDLSHELRTPATVILGEAEISLRAKQATVDDYRLSMSNIASTSRQLNQRISGLLLLAQESLPAQEIKRSPCPLVPILDAAINQAQTLGTDAGVAVLGLQTTLQTITQSITQTSKPTGEPTSKLSSTTSLTSDETAWETPLVRTDPDKLLQILMVFYDNAVRYTPAGGKVTTRLSKTEIGFTLQIVDTGIGIASHEQAELFSRYFRGDQARSMRSDGAGLGLSIAKTLADSLGITISISSTNTSDLTQPTNESSQAITQVRQVQQGCTVTLTLPVDE